MRTLYLECNMGAAGDMLTASLLELLPEPEQKKALEQLGNLALPGVMIRAERSVKCGITGTHMTVTVNNEEEHSLDGTQDQVHHHDIVENLNHDHSHSPEETYNHAHDHTPEETQGHLHDHVLEETQDHALDHAPEEAQIHAHEHVPESDHHGHHHHHTSVQDVMTIVDRMALPEVVRADIRAVYTLIAEAESHAHGMPVDQIHFHEVGTMDAIMDVTAVCLLIHKLHPDQILASPVRVGFGEVRCAHGIMPVPAPATAYLLQGIPTYSGDIRGEMCTPTGAALLRYYVKEFVPQPLMRVDRIGYGMGSKDFPAANCVRAFLGDTITKDKTTGSSSLLDQAAFCSHTDTVLELRCNLDDMTGEEIGYACQVILDAGARDVFTTPIGMKKNRPGTLLTVICSPEDKDKLVPVIFQNTTTLGIRETVCARNVLTRSEQIMSTPLGDVPVKTSTGYGVTRQKAEYDTLAHMAEQKGMTLLDVEKTVGV